MKTILIGALLLSTFFLLTEGALCQQRNSTATRKAKWYNPPGICESEDCYCEWGGGFGYCHGGCTSQKMWYSPQVVTGEAYSRPNLDNFYSCQSIKEHDIDVIANCYRSEDDSLITPYANIKLRVKMPVECGCKKLVLKDEHVAEINENIKKFYIDEETKQNKVIFPA